MAGRFVRANATGKIELAQYTENPSVDITYRKGYGNPVNIVVTDNDGHVVITSDEMVVKDDGVGNVIATISDVRVVDADGNVTLATGMAVPYKQGSLSYETYQTDIIARVQIKNSESDAGVIYPSEADGNCYVISGNMLLGACSSEDMTAVAKTLYEQLSSVTYVPFSVTLPRTLKVRAGEIIGVRDINGHSFISLVMKMTVTPSGVKISSTGYKSYESIAAVASGKFTNLTGKVLEMSKTVDGLVVTNRDLEGKYSNLEMSTEAFKTTVSNTYVKNEEFTKYQNTVSTTFEQTASSFDFKFEETKDAIDALDTDLQEKYNERTSYIRFENGNIILGKTGSEILLIQKNDRISFVRNVKDRPEVAWFADDVLHVTEGEFTVQLGIGKFGFKPGPNGNLSFKKVVD